MSRAPKHTPRKSSSRSRRTSDGLQIIDRQIVGEDSQLRAAINDAAAEFELAQMIHDARIAAGLTQAELARRAGTKQSVISRLEDADYTGHSVSMLRRVAEGLGRQLEIRLAPKTGA